MNLPISGAELLSFILVMLLMLVTPGVNQIMVFQSGLNFGVKAAIYNVAGISASMLVHTALSGLGVALVIIKSPALLGMFKLLGSTYLGWLSFVSIRDALAGGNAAKTSLRRDGEAKGSRFFAQGFTTNILNMQTALVFLAIFPQYMKPDENLMRQSFLLTLVFILLLLSWYGVLIILLSRIRHYLLDDAMQRRIKAGSGGLLLLMALMMLLK